MTLRQQLGADRYQLLVSRCPPQSAALLQRSVLIQEWIETEAWHTIYDVLLRDLYAGNPDGVSQLARHTCGRMLRPWHRTLLGLLSPVSALRMMAMFWRHSLQRARVIVRPLPSTEGRKQVLWQMDDGPSRASFVHTVCGYLQEILSHTRCAVTHVRLNELQSKRFSFLISYD